MLSLHVRYRRNTNICKDLWRDTTVGVPLGVTIQPGRVERSEWRNSLTRAGAG